MPSPVRIVVPTDSMDASSWAAAWGYADAIAAKQGTPIPDVVLLTHTKGQLRHTSLGSALGEPAAKALDNGRTLGLPSGANLRHATIQTARGSLRGCVVVVAYGEDRILDFVDGLSGLIGVVVVPDYPESANKWIERWNPIVLGQERKEAATLIEDPIVETALKGLAIFVNLAHSMIHPRDKAHVNETLRILRAKGHTLDPPKIESWAIRNGWQPKAARELADLAKRIVGLKSKPSLAGFHDPDGRYARWKKESATE